MQLKSDHPDRYTVQKGDTLWDISNKFLKSPWHWPRVWKINDQIRNPHLIYPGDVIVLRYVDGQPELTVLRNEKLPAPTDATPPPAPDATASADAPQSQPVTPAGINRGEKLQPAVRVEPLGGAIPTIPPNVIVPFLTYPLAISEKELERAGYVTVGLDSRIALGSQSEFYARSVKGDDEYFQIFRPGAPIRNPETKELLAYEAIYLGDSKRLEPGDPAKLVVTSAKQEILPTDRLLAAPPFAALPYYYPSAPAKQLRGYIASALNAVAEIGTFGVVATTLGKRDGIEEGNVLRVMRHVGKHRDPITRSDYQLPDEESALLMVFRVYDKMSYGVILRSTRPVHIGDALVTP
ncbi:MAG TPA: LysM domain-containing protein [Burkholderiales bacterium]|nr:LysM domain-containing protein [Burkholderiales bacterium]